MNIFYLPETTVRPLDFGRQGYFDRFFCLCNCKLIVVNLEELLSSELFVLVCIYCRWRADCAQAWWGVLWVSCQTWCTLLCGAIICHKSNFGNYWPLVSYCRFDNRRQSIWVFTGPDIRAERYVESCVKKLGMGFRDGDTKRTVIRILVRTPKWKAQNVTSHGWKGFKEMTILLYHGKDSQTRISKWSLSSRSGLWVDLGKRSLEPTHSFANNWEVFTLKNVTPRRFLHLVQPWSKSDCPCGWKFAEVPALHCAKVAIPTFGT